MSYETGRMTGFWELRRRVQGREETLVLLQYNHKHHHQQNLMVMALELNNSLSSHRLLPSYNRHGRPGLVPLLERSTGKLP
jgi:hypothetical protein